VAVRVESVEFLGKGSLPPALPSSWSELSSGRGVNQWVEIEGVVHSSDGSHVLLECEGEQALATIRSAPAPLVDSLVDAVVRMRGVGTIARDEHQVRGITLIVPSLEYVEVDQPPAPPFSLSAQEISSLLHGIGTKTLRRRVKIEGVLTLQDGSHYFLQDATGSVMAVAKQNIVLSRSGHWVFWQSDQSHEAGADSQIQIKPGDQIEVVGFPEMRGYSPVLTEALFRRLGQSSPVIPIQTDANGVFAGNLDSSLISLDGELLSKQIFGDKTVMELRDGQKGFEAFAQFPVTSVALGSLVRLTGVCQTEPTPYVDFGKSINSFKILVGQEADFRVLQRPPWWDFKHTLAIAAGLTSILAVAFCWIVLLRRQVEKRTILLQREIEERKRIELKMERVHQQLLTTSRLAGMAEVATYVLHNVGNVLNSVNLLGAAIAEDIRNSMVSSVNRLADLLASKGADLGRFVTDDPRGQKVPGHLKRLAAQLAQEQSTINRKVELLTENIQHIKEIVATQHAYAKASGVWENASLEDIVEDALRMQGEILVHHNIKLLRDYDKTPPLFVDRHKVLQILLNLLQNAKHACDKGTAADKQIMVRVRAKDTHRVSVCVQDNGMGIPPENLTRIFAQGFSTRKDGHGFGLHSSVLMAEDMKGSLQAFSAGPNQGAAFTLELPLKQRTDPSGPGDRGSRPIGHKTAVATDNLPT
jgi:signal transduction histidine kinase